MNYKYKTSRENSTELAIPKFIGRFTGLSGFIYDLGMNQTDECIKNTLEIEEYAGKTYGTEVTKLINDLDRKASAFIKPEDLTMDQHL